MAGKKFYVSPETFTDFLLGRDVSARSIDMKGAEHPIFKEAAGVFLGVDDEESCKAVHAYWVRRGHDIVRILKYETNVERKKEARLRYFLEIMGLKLVKRAEILCGAKENSGATEVVSQEKEVEDSRHDQNVSSRKCNYTVSSPQCTAEALHEVVAMEVEVPVCDAERLAMYRDDSSPSSADLKHSEREKERESFLLKLEEEIGEDLIWKKEGEFSLSLAEWREIHDKGLKLRRKWTSLISKKFSSINTTCVIQFQGYHFNKQRRKYTPFLIMRGYCAHVSCKRFRVAMNYPPVENEGALVSVWCQGTERHTGEKKTRQLNGLDRLNIHRARARELAEKYRQKNMEAA